MTGPNFFIVGAPKCGTTALSEYLRTHPNIFMCAPKEPHFFATDFPKHRFVSEFPDYIELFKDEKPKHIAIGEGSVWYLYSRDALYNIKKYKPDSKIIVMLRNPIELVQSMHTQALYNVDEDEPDFERAWQLQDDRLRGACLPRDCRASQILQYRDLGRLGQQVERLFWIFPQSQIMPILFDDFVRYTDAVYREVLTFLGVPDDGRTEFPKVNESRQHRFLSMGRYLHGHIGPTRKAWGWFKRMTGTRFGLGDWLRKNNTVPWVRPALGDGFRKELIDTFEGDIRKLETILGRSLEAWFR